MPFNSAIIRIFILALGLFLALYFGILVATDQLETLFWISLAGGILLCVWLGKDIWLLIPTTMYLNLSFPWLPGAFPPSQIAILVVFSWSLLLILMRRLPLDLKITHIEIAALILLISIFQCYVRNPVGMLSLGSDQVGAKPYFNVAIAVIGAALLASIRVTPERVRLMVKCMLGGSVFSFFTNFLAYLSSSVASVTGRYLGAWGNVSAVDFGGATDITAAVDTTAASRIGCAVEGATLISRWLVSKFNPIRALIHPGWGIILLLACGFAGMSGYRNVLISVGFTLAFGTYYWGKGRSLFAAMIVGGVAYVLLNLVNLVAPLPPNVQRSLTFLPGTWGEEYKLDAEHSTKWRTDMWKLALFTDRYIQNKLLGDGLGMTMKEYQFLRSLGTMSSGLSEDLSQERAMITQAYHSGPVQTIRVTGYVGLFILLYAMVVVSVSAHRLIIRTRGTEWFGPVLFLTLHMVWHPIFFTLVFGAFKEDVPSLLLNMGILRLLQRNLPLGSNVPVTVNLSGPAWRREQQEAVA